MSDSIIASVQKEHLRNHLPVIHVGDTVDVHVKIIEGEKSRIQVFQGVVIKKQNGGLEETFTVRRIVANEGVERTFPMHSPRIDKVDIVRRGDTRRAKLYYLRDRVGKKRRLRDRRRGLETVSKQEAANAESRKAAEAAKPKAEAAAE